MTAMNKTEARMLAGRAKRCIKDLIWEIYGRRIKAAELCRPPRSILFICKGNICRSPFADRLAKKIFDGSQRYTIAVDSAGLDVKTALPSPPNAVEAAGNFGIDLRSHRSKRFTAEMFGEFDMIVAMETGQYQALLNRSPETSARLFLLPFFEDGKMRPGGYERYNVADPYGKGIEEFIRCFQRIERCLAGMAKLIHAL
jgi:protein-tyrosine phosphatase